MRLVDEEQETLEQESFKKVRKAIIIAISIMTFFMIIILALILYIKANPSTITTYIDGNVVKDFDKILDIQYDENGKTEFYIPIKDFAPYLNLGYQTFRGDYEPKTEEENKCYSIRDKYEVAVFTEKSKIIYKKNLQSNSEEYTECYIDKDVFLSNGKLYASKEGIEKGFNVVIDYNEKKKIVRIYTLDYFINLYKTILKNKTYGDYGTLDFDIKNYENCKTLFDNLLIVNASNKKYGIMRIIDKNNVSFILEPKYDSIDFISESKTFLVKSNGKVGVVSENGDTKIDLIYDKITSMGQKSNLYMVQANNLYGVVDENGQNIIYPEYSKIGMDVKSFSYNGVKNGYILLNELIPVMQEKLWGFYNIKENKWITDDFKYTTIGCTNIPKGNNIYSLLEVPDKKVLIVGDSYKKYSFMDLKGKDSMLPFVFDSIYIKITNGETKYYMVSDNKRYEVDKYLK